MNLKHLTDKSLILETKRLVSQERRFSTEILHHLKEIDRRKLFSDYGYSSMINYAIKELQYSESAALRRIQSARLLADIPEIENKINDGSLSLSNLQKASNFFKQENIQDIGGKLEVIEKLEGKTAREAEKTLFELGTTPVLPPESVKPVSASFTQVKVNVSDETYNLMTKARSILGEFSFGDSYMSKVACEAIENINRKKYKLTSKGRNTETSGRVPTASQQRII